MEKSLISRLEQNDKLEIEKRLVCSRVLNHGYIRRVEVEDQMLWIDTSVGNYVVKDNSIAAYRGGQEFSKGVLRVVKTYLLEKFPEYKDSVVFKSSQVEEKTK